MKIQPIPTRKSTDWAGIAEHVKANGPTLYPDSLDETPGVARASLHHYGMQALKIRVSPTEKAILVSLKAGKDTPS